MFSNLSQNSILYILDLTDEPKILNGPVERVTLPRPKYNNFNPTMEMIVDITATINGEKREFKGVPNSSIANFGSDAFIIAESKDALNSYVNAMLQNSQSVLDSVEKHKKLVEQYTKSLEALNPSLKSERVKDEAISALQDQVKELKEMLAGLSNLKPKTE